MHKLGLIMCKSHVIGVFMPPKLHNFLFQAFDAFLSSTRFRYRLFPFPCDKIHAWFSKYLMYRWPLLNRHQVNDWLVSNIMRGKYQNYLTQIETWLLYEQDQRLATVKFGIYLWHNIHNLTWIYSEISTCFLLETRYQYMFA